MDLLDNLPVWGVYLTTVVAVLIAAEVGFQIGGWLKRRNGKEGPPISGTVVGGMLGLLAFLMAFAVGIVSDQHNGRKAMVVTEANAVGTAYLRTSFLDEPDASTMRDLLREYVEIRLAAAADPEQMDSVLARSEQIHGELWTIVESNADQGADSEIFSLLVESINEVIDVHTLRLTAVSLRLPQLFGTLLYGALLLSFLLVGISNSSDGNRNLAGMIVFALAFVAVGMIIVDLDRPSQGLVNVSQTALTDLLRQMQAPPN